MTDSTSICPHAGRLAFSTERLTLGVGKTTPYRKKTMSAESNLLSGKVAIVTGGGRDIGRAIAPELAGAGAAIVVNARASKRVEKRGR